MASLSGGQVVWIFDADTGEFNRALAEASDNAKRTAQTIDSSMSQALSSASRSMADSLDSVSNQIGRVLKGAVALGITGSLGLGAMTKAAFDQVRAVQNAAFGLKAYEKNASKVTETLSSLVKYAQSDMGVLFQRQDLFKAANTLKVFGVQTDKLTGYVKTLSKGVALGYTSFDELSFILGRVISQGKLTGDSFDMLISRGIKLPDSMRNAKVSADQLFAALNKVLPDKILEGRAQTIDGQMIRLQSAFRNLGASILGVNKNADGFVKGSLGEKFMDVMDQLRTTMKDPTVIEAFKKIGNALADLAKDLLPKIISGIKWFGDNIDTIIPIVKKLVVAFIALKVAAIGLRTISTVSKVFGGVTSLFGGLGKAMDKLPGRSASNAFSGLGKTIAAIFKPLGKPEVLRGAASVVLVAAGLLLFAIALGKASSIKINLANLGIMAAAVVVSSVIFGLIGALGGAYVAVGSIAVALMGVALLSIAAGISAASAASKSININSMKNLLATVLVVSAIMSIIGLFGQFAAIGAIVTTVLGVGLLVAAKSLASTADYAKLIDGKAIVDFSKTIAKVSAILAAISLLGTFAAIGSVITSVITLGILYAVKQLAIAVAIARTISANALDNLEKILLQVSGWETGGIISNIQKMISSGALAKMADNISSTIKSLSGLKPIDNRVIDSLNANIRKLSELQTQGVIKSVGDMFSSGNLAKVAENIKSIINNLNGLKPINSDAINSLKDNIHSLSLIDIRSGRLFQNRGADAESLAFVIWKIRDIAANLNATPMINASKVNNIIISINYFDALKNSAMYQLSMLSRLGNSIGNLNWLKFILGDVPPTIVNSVTFLVNAVNKFAQISNDAKSQLVTLSHLGDTLGNLNWIKFILGDVTADIVQKATWLVTAINKFNGLIVNAINVQAVASAVSNLGNSIKTSLNNLGPQFKSAGSSITTNLANGMSSVLATVTTAALSLQSAMWRAIQSKFPDEYQQGRYLALQVANGARSAADGASNAGASLQGAFWLGIQRKFRDEYLQGSALANQVISGINSRSGSSRTAGSNVGYGFANGISSTVGSINAAVGNLSSAAINTLRDLLGIHSPSTVMASIGANLGEGLALGIAGTQGVVNKAFSSLTGGFDSQIGMNINSSSNNSSGASGAISGGITINGNIVLPNVQNPQDFARELKLATQGGF